MYWHDCVYPQNLNHKMLEDHLSIKIEPHKNFQHVVYTLELQPVNMTVCIAF